jgi:type IV fimbrial biogenesis protein FimT
MRRAASGFTLLEMMIVIAILGIVAAIAFPSFTYLSANTKIKNASTELYLALIRARNEAVKRNRLVSVTRNAGGWAAGWQIIADQNNDGDFVDAEDRVLVDAGALKRITITASQASIVFMASGRVQGTGTPTLEVVSQENPGMKRCITADLTGKPYTKEGPCS